MPAILPTQPLAPHLGSSLDIADPLPPQLIAPTSANAGTPKPLTPDLSLAPGEGLLEFTRVAGATAVTRAQASSPLKLLCPRGSSTSAWIFASTYGGGLVAGDSIDLHVRAGASTTSLLSTQASTKIYPAIQTSGSSQSLQLRAETDSVCVIAPDPITCYAKSIYTQTQQIDLEGSASIVLVDWLTSGRRARGERWAFSRYQSKTEVTLDGRTVFRDAILLDPAHGDLAAPDRLGALDCLATVLIIGSGLLEQSQTLLRDIASRSARPPPDRIFLSASPVDQGALLRVGAPSVEAAARFIRSRLAFVPGFLGNDPWLRKW